MSLHQEGKPYFLKDEDLGDIREDGMSVNDEPASHAVHETVDFRLEPSFNTRKSGLLLHNPEDMRHALMRR